MTQQTKLLNKKAFQGLVKIGEIIIPGQAGFLSYSESNKAQHVDRMIKHLNEDDKKGIILLLSLLGFIPSFFLKIFIKLIFNYKKYPKIISPLINMIMLGLKGLVMTTYYSAFEFENSDEDEIYKKLEWESSTVEAVEDEEMEAFIQSLDHNSRLS